VSIPKRWVTRRFPEGSQVERADTAPELAPQRREARVIDAARPQGEAVRSLRKLEPVPGGDTEGLENPGRKRDLALCGYPHEHLIASLLEISNSKVAHCAERRHAWQAVHADIDV
jgi:hypothetical protein